MRRPPLFKRFLDIQLNKIKSNNSSHLKRSKTYSQNIKLSLRNQFRKKTKIKEERIKIEMRRKSQNLISQIAQKSRLSTLNGLMSFQGNIGFNNYNQRPYSPDGKSIGFSERCKSKSPTLKIAFKPSRNFQRNQSFYSYRDKLQNRKTSNPYVEQNEGMGKASLIEPNQSSKNSMRGQLIQTWDSKT
eukprot:403343907